MPKNPPQIPFTAVDAIAEWSNFHHTIVGRHVPSFMTPGGVGAPQRLPSGGVARSRALAQALSAVLTYCKTASPPERLCTLGSRWSLSNVLDPGSVVLDPGAWNQITSVSPAWLTDDYEAAAPRGAVPIIAQGGTRIRELNRVLGARNLAIQTSGASDGHRIAGCIATGTHGSDLKVGAVHDTVLAMYLVTGPNEAALVQPSTRRFTGDLARWFQDQTSLVTQDVADDELFDAARVALGALGFVHSVILEAVPLYELQGKRVARRLDDADLWHAIETLDTTRLDPTPSPDFFSVVMSPYASRLGAYATLLWKRSPSRPYAPPDPVRPPISSDTSRLLSALIPRIDGACTRREIEAIINDETGKQYPPGMVEPMFPGTCFGPTNLPEGNGRSTELVIDHDNTRDALRVVLATLREEAGAGRHLLGGIGVRFVPGTTALLGMNVHERNTYIELPTLGSVHTNRVYGAVWAALRAKKIPFTCHWGQEYGMNAESVRAYFGDRVDRWKAARARLLPTPLARVVFATPLLRNVGLDDRAAPVAGAARPVAGAVALGEP